VYLTVKGRRQLRKGISNGLEGISPNRSKHGIRRRCSMEAKEDNDRIQVEEEMGEGGFSTLDSVACTSKQLFQIFIVNLFNSQILNLLKR
jgi:hypothetical protein